LNIFKESHIKNASTSPESSSCPSSNEKGSKNDTAAQAELAMLCPSQGQSDLSGFEETSNQTSHSTPTSSSGNAAKLSSQANPEFLASVTHENLQIRNTFIHIGDLPVDERVVQSMPHGMFKQCLSSEAVEAFKGAPFCDTPTSAGGGTPVESDVDADHTSQSSTFSPGALVKVEGLVKLPTFNGCSAVVQGWDESTGRYNILIACSGGIQQAKIKEGNLSILLPCP
jgi:hypothetical protein